jgi:hypothetical protein
MRCIANEVFLGANFGKSNGNDIETKANEIFDNGIFFDIE